MKQGLVAFLSICTGIFSRVNLLPVLRRELGVRARRKGTYWTRCIVASLGVIVCLPFVGLDDDGDPNAVGRFAFVCMVTTGFLLGFAACLLTADLISSERREGTLGILLLTRVRSFEILLGKLASVGLAAGGGLLAFLPMLMVPVLAGAVTGQEVCLNGLALLDLLWLALAVGLSASVRSVDSVAAARRALIALACLVLLPAMVEGLVRGTGGFTSGIGLFSPLMTILDADAGSGPLLFRYALSLVLVQALGWGVLVRANAKLRTSLQDESVKIAPTTQAFKEFLPGNRRKNPARPENADPIEWAVRHQPGIRAMTLGAGIIAILFCAGNWLFYRVVGYPPPGYLGLIIQPFYLGIALTVKGLIARASSRFFSEARRNGELEILLTTPRGARAILSGQWRALVRLLRWPIGISIVFEYISAVSVFSQAEIVDTAHFWWVTVPISLGLDLVVTVAGLLAACWLGMWYGLKGQTALATIAKAAGLTAGVPFLARIAFDFALAVPLIRLFGSDLESWMVVSWSRVGFLLIYYLALIRFARRRIKEQLSTGRASWP